MKNVFIELITHFLRVICSNQERITDITLFLRNQELQSEKDLKDLLKSYDKTEFAEENVE